MNRPGDFVAALTLTYIGLPHSAKAEFVSYTVTAFSGVGFAENGKSAVLPLRSVLEALYERDGSN